MCWSLFLIKLQALSPLNIAKIIRTAFYIKHLWWLLLSHYCYYYLFSAALAFYFVLGRKDQRWSCKWFNSTQVLLNFYVPLVLLQFFLLTDFHKIFNKVLNWTRTGFSCWHWTCAELNSNRLFVLILNSCWIELEQAFRVDILHWLTTNFCKKFNKS